jgi:SAM-dependent methyltransferase
MHAGGALATEDARRMRLNDQEAWAAAVKHLSADVWPGQQAYLPFMEKASSLVNPRVLELGTRRAIPERSTRKDALFPHASEYIGTDIEPGVDVDLIADVHRLTEVTGEESFDIIWTEAGFEHFKYPHLAAHQIMKALKVGGLLFVQTHQTFPIHAVPYDYFRFSKDAMASLFGTKMGMQVHTVCYASPAAIYSRVDPGGHRAPAFLHVALYAEKVAKTPAEFIYEYDCLL